MALPTICLYVVGDTKDRLRAEHGSFEDWFARLFAEHQVSVDIVDGRTCQLPDIARYAGIVTTGSRSSLTEPEPWMEAAVELIRQAYAQQVPFLGVCFGHQLIGAAFGGSVVRNPIGWQVSTRSWAIHDHSIDDPLFDGLDGSGSLTANWAHQDMVDGDTLSPMNGIRVLARSEKAEIAAVAAGPTIRGVQFHPEITGAIGKTIIETRHNLLAREAKELNRPDDHPDRLVHSSTDAPAGERVFHNFIRHFILA